MLRPSIRFTILALLLTPVAWTQIRAQVKKPTPAPPKAAPKPAAVSKPAGAPSAAHPTATPGRPGTTPVAGRPGAPGATAGRPGAPGASAGRPGAPGVTRGPNGATTTRTGDNRSFTRAPDGHLSSFHGAHGEEAHFGRDGHVNEIRSGNMHIQRGPGGSRRVELERPDHSRLVSEGRGRGYIQRPFSYHNRPYFSRQYYHNGVAYSRFYHPYYYHGLYLHGYVPGVFYAPALYGWAYSPWARPVPYRWGFIGAPWYGAYGVYFAPYPVYPAPAYWLTDYIISQQLEAAYAAGAAAGAAGNARLAAPTSGPHLVYASYSPSPAYEAPVSSGGTQMTPAIKQLLSTSIQAYIMTEKAEAAAGGDESKGGTSLDQLLSDGKSHVFLASAAITVSPSTGDCGLTEGDVLQTSNVPAADATTLDVAVLASKSGDCPANSTVPVKIEDLQEMQNSMMATVDQGLGELKAHPGQGGLPAPPADALAGQTDAPYSSAAPAADPNEATELQQADQQATQTEQQVAAEATPPADAGGAPTAAPGSASAPVTIKLGQSTTDILLGKGRPKQIVNLGAKQIYVYDDMKIVFINGKVSDVQ